MERFTMDEGLSHIVRRVFVQLYNEGLIYRGERMINWCPKDQTALSNIEVEHKEVNGHLYYVRYPLEGAEHDGNKYLLVATTRPETILGDEALAVHPEDERYAHLKGAKAKVPFINKLIPIVFDDSVDKDFGTGVVKVTPAHDFNDFATGTRHKLPFTNIMTESAHMNDLAGPYKGLSREACRKKIVEDLEAAEMIEKIDSHKQSVGHSYRSGAVVEPRLSLQWFVKVRPLADKAVSAVTSGATQFYPKRWENLFFDWMQKIEDWCISRQLWWGHQVPAWYCQDCEGVTVSISDATECSHCKSKNIARDKDVLDTWFSSALWPFSTLMPQEIPKSMRSGHPPPRVGEVPKAEKVTRPPRVRSAGELLPDLDACHGLRHHLLLGVAHADDGHALHGSDTLRQSDYPLARARRQPPEDVEVEGQRRQSARKDG
jgi:valyl-tRNA synthetase